MKKITTLVLISALSLSASAALAAFNTGSSTFALPQGWTMGTDRGYGTPSGLNGNPVSTMCVDCHTVNPSGKIVAPTDTAGYTTTNLRAERGSHFVMNKLATGATNAYGTTTPKAGGATGMYNNAADADNKYFPAAMNNMAYASIKVGNRTAFTNAADLSAAVDIICESCHNIVTNGGDQLLVDQYSDNNSDMLCLRCHGNSGSGTTRNTLISNFQAAGNLPAFKGTTTRKRHHVIGGLGGTAGETWTLSTNYTTANGSLMWAPQLGNKVSATWCTTKGATGVTPTVLDTEAVAFRGECTSTGQGTKLAANAKGDILPPADATLSCANCHRPHNAMTRAGAYILRGGADTYAAAQYAGVTGNVTGSFGTDDDKLGIRRQKDVGSYGTGTAIYGEYSALCKSCHQGY